MALATPGLALALLPAWRAALPRLPRLLAAAMASAALPYAWMVWLSHQGPVVNFYGPIDGWGDFWFYVSRQGYSGVDVSPSAGWSDRWLFLAWLAGDLVRQTTLPGVVLAGLGLASLARGRGWVAGIASAGSGLLALLGTSVALIGLLAFDFDEFRLALFRPYPLICYGTAALWVAAGMQWLICRATGWWSGIATLAGAARGAAAASALAGAAMVATSASAGWPANNRSGNDFTERYVEALFDGLPEDAVLFVHGEASGPVGYYRHVEERRTDVALYNLHGLVFGDRLYDPRLPEEDKARALDRFVGSTERRVFLSADADIHPGERRRRYYGFLMEVLDVNDPDNIELARHPGGERYFLELVDRRPVDRWEATRRNGLLFRCGNYLGLAALSGIPDLQDPMEELIRRTDDCYPCLVSMASTFLDNPENRGGTQPERIAGWLARAEALRGQALTKAATAQLPYEQGRLAELTGESATAAARYRQSYALHPHPRNDAGAALRRLGLAP